jgi:hypothetical protein
VSAVSSNQRQPPDQPPASPNRRLPATPKPGSRWTDAEPSGLTGSGTSRLRDGERRPGALFRGRCCHSPAGGVKERLRCTVRRHAGLAGSARLEECDHGENAAVVIVGLLQIQLDEDAADVFLDGALLVPGKASIL